MVQKIVSTIFILLAGFLVACGIFEGKDEGNIAGSILVLKNIEPASASRGSHVEISGDGFSVVAQENVVVFIGGSDLSAIATNYTVTNDGDEVIGFDVPNDAPTGEVGIVVTVEGETSNPLNFTITP